MPAAPITVQLGLFSVPVKATKATATKTSNKTLCVGQGAAHDPLAIRQPQTCEVCGKIEDITTLKKGVLLDDGGYAIIDQDTLAQTREEFTKDYKKVMNLVAHPAADVLNSTAPGDQLNYLEPVVTGDCAEACKGCPTCRYALLVKLVEDHPEIAFTSLYTPRSSTSIFVLRASKGVLMMEQRTRAEDLKAAPAIHQPAKFKDMLYAQMEGFLNVEAFDPAEYEDRYSKAVAEIAAKAEAVALDAGGTATAKVSTISDEDLMAKLILLKQAS